MGKTGYHKKPGPINGPTKRPRTCLKCQKEFMSEGAYNRICPNCRQKNKEVRVTRNDRSEAGRIIRRGKDVQ